MSLPSASQLVATIAIGVNNAPAQIAGTSGVSNVMMKSILDSMPEAATNGIPS